jgi:hypothetical protein
MLTLINDWCLRTKVGKLGNTIIFVVAGAVYLASYVFFYLVGAVNHYGAFEVAIWNPGAGLSIAAVLIFGPRMMPLLFASPLLGMIALPLAEAAND